MTIKISNIVLDINESEKLLKSKAAKKLRIKEKDIQNLKIVKESIDARKKNNIRFNYSLALECNDELKIIKRNKDKDILLEKEKYVPEIEFGNKKLNTRPVVIGMGPAGLFAGLILAKNGYKPLIFERGENVDERTKTVEDFWITGQLNPESNVQFGEGGAGTFSDGKLTTRIKDYRCDYVVEEFVKAGAQEEIRYKGKPHVGTDVLKEVVKNIRNTIISLGGEVRFNSRLEDFIIKNNKLNAIIVNGETIPCETAILAIGHSSRDTYEMLYKNKIFMAAKPFAIGARVEHSQRMINENQFGKFANHPRLKAADYKLTYTSKDLNRSVYSFCMCPGGQVVAAASENGRLVVNGMSYSSREGENANAAIVVSVGPQDFNGNSPLAGMEFQREYEKLAYNIAGGNYTAPIQLVEDFLKDKKSKKIGSIKPSYNPGYEFCDLKNCLPKYVTDSLKEAFIKFDNKIKGFAANDAVLTGIETRTSAPVRIQRNENMESITLSGLYPAGEGAGYAGGIISAAVDGIKVAESIIKEWNYSE